MSSSRSTLGFLTRILPRYSYQWYRLADRWTWMDRRGERARLDQYERAKAFSRQPAREFRGPCDPGGGALDVEVLITAYGYRDYLESAVESAWRALQDLAGNGYRGGLAIVEDCGKDGSWELGCRLAERSPVPMRILQPRENVGLTGARNLGLFTSHSRTLFILDADNTVARGGLTPLLELLDREGAAAAYGPLEMVDEAGQPIGWVSDRPPDREHLMTVGNHIDAMALFDCGTLKRLGGWDPELLKHCWGLEDYELWVRLLREGEHIAHHTGVVGRYLEKGDSMARAFNPRSLSRFNAYMRRKHGPEFSRR